MEKTKFGLIVVETIWSSQVRCDGYIVNIEPINGETLQRIFRKFIIHNYNCKQTPTGFIKSVNYFSAHELRNCALTNERTVLARDVIFLREQPKVFNTSDFNTVRTYAIPRKPTN